VLNLRPAILAAAAVLSTTASLGAQTFEAGGSIATSCKGSDGSFCNDSHSNLLTAGPYGGVWFDDRIEVSGRVAWLSQPDLRGETFIIEPFTFAITDRRRTIAQAEVVWHFRRGKRARPMFGVGLGRFFDRETVTCEPAGCESRLGVSGLSAGRVRESHYDESLVVGLSVLLKPRVRLRSGWRYHNPFRDELALSELFLAVGLRFGRE
jgi:hypothetical protein